MGTELATINQASSLLSSVVTAASTLYVSVRTYGIATAADRQALKDQVAYARARNIANSLADLGILNIERTFDLFDLLADRAGSPGYEAAYRSATHTVRVLQDNLDNLARRLR